MAKGINLCSYCQNEIATEMDHVIPVSFNGKDNPNNLVPACRLCNALAYNKLFDSFESKRDYILHQRSKKKRSKLTCLDCGDLLTINNSATAFLCKACHY